MPLSLSFLKLFSSVYGGASLITALRSPHPAPYFPFELRLPFLPSMAAVYLTVPLAMLLTPFILRTWREFVPFFLTLTAETLTAGLCFLLLPFARAYPPRIASGFWGGIFHFADVLNLEYNQVPSLHVTFAVTLALVFGRRCGSLGRFLLIAWAAVVCLSTLLIHEHHLVDVASGIVLAAAALLAVQRPASREPVLHALRIEALCLREVWHFTRRHPRYLLTALALWAHSLPRWRASRLLRASWCLAQMVDDVLDGDRKVEGDAEGWVEGLMEGMVAGAPAEGSAVLAAYVWDGLGALQTGTDDPRGDLLALFARLRLDRRRMDGREVWSAAALAEQHRETFERSLNLTLLLDGAALRAADVPELVEALAWCSPVRDLEEDLAKGLINLPAEVLGPLTPRPPLPSPPPNRERGRETRIGAGIWFWGGRRRPSPGGWEGMGEGLGVRGPAVQAWLAAEHRRGAAAIEALGRKLPGMRDRGDLRGREIVSAFHRALASYEKKYRRRHRIVDSDGEGLLAGHDAAH